MLLAPLEHLQRSIKLNKSSSVQTFSKTGLLTLGSGTSGVIEASSRPRSEAINWRFKKPWPTSDNPGDGIRVLNDGVLHIVRFAIVGGDSHHLRHLLLLLLHRFSATNRSSEEKRNVPANTQLAEIELV